MNKSEQDGIRKSRFQKTNFENFLFTLIHSYASLFTAVHCYSLLLPRRKVPRVSRYHDVTRMLHIKSNNSSNTKSENGAIELQQSRP